VLLRRSSSAVIAETNRRKCEAGYFSVRSEELSMMLFPAYFSRVSGVAQAPSSAGVRKQIDANAKRNIVLFAVKIFDEA
jgi:hypothetical protein